MLQSIIYTNKDNVSDGAYIQMMKYLSRIYKDTLLLRHIHEDGIQCPHCQEAIDSDEIELDD